MSEVKEKWLQTLFLHMLFKHISKIIERLWLKVFLGEKLWIINLNTKMMKDICDAINFPSVVNET